TGLSAPNNGGSPTFPANNSVTPGIYILGPKDDLPDPAVKTTLRGKDQMIGMQQSAPAYTNPGDQFPKQAPSHSVLLRRLTCPYMPPQPDPAQANYNPYVTVDYMDGNVIPNTNNRAKVTNTGANPNYVNDITQTASVGKRQPYAASKLEKQT